MKSNRWNAVNQQALDALFQMMDFVVKDQYENLIFVEKEVEHEYKKNGWRVEKHRIIVRMQREDNHSDAFQRMNRITEAWEEWENGFAQGKVYCARPTKDQPPNFIYMTVEFSTEDK